MTAREQALDKTTTYLLFLLGSLDLAALDSNLPIAVGMVEKAKAMHDCIHPGALNCGQENETRLACTLAPGHDGDHVACGISEHSLAQWPVRP